MANTTVKGKFKVVDERGNTQTIYLKTTGDQVLVDRSSNASVIPNDVANLQHIINKMGSLALKSKVETSDFITGTMIGVAGTGNDPCANLKANTDAGKIADALIVKNIESRVDTLENSNLVTVDELDAGLATKPDTEINDAVTSTSLTWSSKKLSDQLTELNSNTQLLNTNIRELVPTETAKWLNENISPVGSSVIIDKTLSTDGASADAKVTGDLINRIYSKNIDTDLIINAIFEQGSYGNILNYLEPNPINTNLRIKSELHVSANKVHIYSNDGYSFAYSLFDSNGNRLQYSSGSTNTDITYINEDIYTIRVVIKHIDNSNILISEGYHAITIIINDIPISISGILDKINSVNDNTYSNKLSIYGLKDYLYGKRYTDYSEWVQGGYGFIGNFENPDRNTSPIRIRTELNIDNKKLSILYSDNFDYQYIYAFIDEYDRIIKHTGVWSNGNITIPYNTKSIRLSIRKVDDSKITIDDYKNSGVYIKESGIFYNRQIKLKVMTYNIGEYSYGVSPYYLSTNYDEKLNNYKKFFMTQNCDLIGFQEQGEYLDENHTVSANDMIFNYLYPYNNDVSNWTCIKSKYKLSNSGYGIFSTSNRKYVFSTLIADDKEIFIMCVHLTPNPGQEQDEKRDAEIAEILSILSSKEYFIIFGDFNAQTPELFNKFINVGYKIANGGYLPFEWTYSLNKTDFSNNNPSSSIRYFDNIVTSSNIIINNSYRVNVYDDLSSDHIPFIADLIID